MRIGIIAAMEEEVVFLKEHITDCKTKILAGFEFYTGKIGSTDVVLLRSGIGKVASAVSTTLLINRLGVDFVINIGSAGAVDPRLNIGDVVVSEYVNYSDADLTAFGYQFGQMAGCPPRFKADAGLLETALSVIKKRQISYLLGDIVSSDRFVNDVAIINEVKSRFPEAIAVEMEAASIGHVCWIFSIPFVVVRAISDRSDKQSAMEFDEFLPLAAKMSTDIVLEMIGLI